MTPASIVSAVAFTVGFGGSCWLMYHYWISGRHVPLLIWSCVAVFSICVGIAAGLYDWASAHDSAGTRKDESRPSTTGAAPDPTARPWITIKKVAFHLTEGQPFTVTLEFTNSGRIPAAEIAQKWRTGIQTDLLNVRAMPPLQLLPNSVLGTLPPGIIAFGDTEPRILVTKPMMNDLNSGRAGAYAYGVLEYWPAGDVRPEKPYVTGFCFKARAGDLNGPSEQYDPASNYNR